MADDDPSEHPTGEELARRLAVLRDNVRELRAAALACARTHPDSAADFEEMALAFEDAEATLADSIRSEEDLEEVYRETLHRLQDVRRSFDEERVAAIDAAVASRLRSWE